MIKMTDIFAAVERMAPLALQEEWDHSGVQIVPELQEEVKGVLVCLDVTDAVLSEAVREGCNLVVSHHPLLFRPLAELSDRSGVQRLAVRAIREGISVYAAHTNLDNAEGGVSYAMARELGLEDVRPLRLSPVSRHEGAVGRLPVPEVPAAFAARLRAVFAPVTLRHNGFSGRKIETVALCGGSGAYLLEEACAQGVDAFVTGEIHYHDWFETSGRIFAADLGHYESERCAIGLLCGIIAEAFPGLKVRPTTVSTNPVTAGYGPEEGRPGR